MIKLNKGNMPEILREKGHEWTEEYLTGLRDRSLTKAKRFRYREPTIKEALRRETDEKCAYCEGKISHIHPGETDHILPISCRPDLSVEWDNLTYVCTECNRRKSSYYDEEEPLVNPYVNEPAEHLLFLGPLVMHRDDMGLRTTKWIGLSRLQLLERKQELLERVNLLIDQWRDKKEGMTKQILWCEILKFASNRAEYAATIRTLIRERLGRNILDARAE